MSKSQAKSKVVSDATDTLGPSFIRTLGCGTPVVADLPLEWEPRETGVGGENYIHQPEGFVHIYH